MPRILARADHPISRSAMDRNAVKVLYRLHNAGYEAYLVGGSVRDLMLGREPKDYDAGTNAHPGEIRRLFRNSRIIGRRFRLVHIFFHDSTIEVSTFRREPDPDEQRSSPGELLITSDNAYGSPEEDAFRRDFTINALFYSIADHSVIDYVGGIQDLEEQLVRAIGDPDVRFQEDPVRMVRACEFAARLGFGIEDRTQEAILAQREELQKASPARMAEEIVQLLGCGASGSAVQWMLDLGLAEVVMPEVLVMLDRDAAGEDLSGILPVVDRMVTEGRELPDSVLLAALLVASVLAERSRAEASRGELLSRAAVAGVVKKTVTPFFDRLALSNARCQAVTATLIGFQRLCEPQKSETQRRRVAGGPRFADALALFEILCRATGQAAEELELWKAAGEDPLPPGGEPGLGAEPRGPRRRRRRRRRRRPGGASESRGEAV